MKITRNKFVIDKNITCVLINYAIMLMNMAMDYNHIHFHPSIYNI